MSITSPELTALKQGFLEYFPDECRGRCLVAEAAATLAARQVIEFNTTFEKVGETVAHRFGRCDGEPEHVGRCGVKTICHNELVKGIENPLEARDVLATI